MTSGGLSFEIKNGSQKVGARREGASDPDFAAKGERLKNPRAKLRQGREGRLAGNLRKGLHKERMSAKI